MRARVRSVLIRPVIAYLVIGCVLAIGLLEAQENKPSIAQGGQRDAGVVLPRPSAPFGGVINLRQKDSIPEFPKPIQPPKGAPNVLLVLLDDVGFGAAGTFGGPCQTPTLDRLAKNGLKYNQFHTTALCSPTRAALLTGRNHHVAHTGTIMETGTGFPGYDTLLGPETATVAEVFRQNGYGTAWFGKNHNVPDFETSQVGPFDRWPTRLGFDHFYGFVGGDTSQWRPNAYDGARPIEPYIGDPNYNFDYDIADKASAWIRMQKAVAPHKPFFCYYAPGATHAPHHPRKEWVAKYKGKFDQGWDKVREETFARQKELGVVPRSAKLTPRAPGIPAWDALSADEKAVFARMMEVYAAYLEQTDFNVGRVIQAIEDLGQLENTLVVYIVGDNGASAEGTRQGLLNEMTFFNGVPEQTSEVLKRIDDVGTWKTYNHYPIGWAHAMCTPFQWTKQIASHYGGTRNGMVVSWPAGIKARGEQRTQWHHTIDVAPTLMEVAGLSQPAIVNGVAQRPIEGMSFVYTFSDPAAKSRRRTQYFEMFGNRAVYHDGWVACTTPVSPPWELGGEDHDVIDGYHWELYHVDEDFSQADDLSRSQPDRLKDLQLLFYAEAAKNDVLPIDNRRQGRFDSATRPSLTNGRRSFTYTQGLSRIPEGASPDLKNRSWKLTADVEVEAGASGMIFTEGGLFGGLGLYLEKGRPVFHYNFVDVEHTSVTGSAPLAPGKHTLVVDFAYDGGGPGRGAKATLSVDGAESASGRIERTIPVRVTLDEGLDVGEDAGTPLNLSYDVPFRFKGTIRKVTVDLK
jgi:arylsulfatase A-like enzyme